MQPIRFVENVPGPFCRPHSISTLAGDLYVSWQTTSPSTCEKVRQ